MEVNSKIERLPKAELEAMLEAKKAELEKPAVLSTPEGQPGETEGEAATETKEAAGPGGN